MENPVFCEIPHFWVSAAVWSFESYYAEGGPDVRSTLNVVVAAAQSPKDSVGDDNCIIPRITKATRCEQCTQRIKGITASRIIIWLPQFSPKVPHPGLPNPVEFELTAERPANHSTSKDVLKAAIH